MVFDKNISSVSGSSSKIDFIHVGIQKTGSTWLQEGYFTLHPELNMHGSLSKRPRHENNFIASFYGSDFNLDSWKQEFDRLVQPHPTKMTGLTNEQFSGHLWSMDQGIELADRIKNVFGDVKIILVLRDPITFIQSGYIQSIKSGTEIHSLKKVLSDKKKRQAIIHRVSYMKLIEAYHRNFSNVLVLPYELLRNDQQEFLSRISSFLGVSELDHNAIRDTTKNKGVSRVAQNIMRFANLMDRIVFTKKRYINKAFRKLIKFLPATMRKMKPLTKDDLLKYEGFDKVLQADNYTIWQNDLSNYNYFQ